MVASAHRKKTALRLLATAIGLALVFLLAVLRYSKDKFTPTAGDRLRVIAKYQVPMQEVSGMARLDDKIYLVGDSTPELVVIDFPTMKVLNRLDFFPLLRERFSLCSNAQNNICDDVFKTLGTQWEGIHVRSDERADEIALLQESTGSVFIFDSQLTALKEHILLDYRINKTEENRTRESENSLGEGVMLLGNGNVLVAKEKLPTAIMEFTATSTAQNTGIVRKEMQVAHTWRLTSEDERCDLSDLAKAPDSEAIYGISQTCHSIYRFKELDKDLHELVVERRWLIPDEVIAPEGLIVTADGKFIVCSDIAQIRDNVFVLH